MELLIVFLLILINGFFSMSEISIVSARKSRLAALAKRGDKRAKAALNTANNPNSFLSTVQIGITLIGILTGIFSGEKITDNLTRFLENKAVLSDYAEPIAIGIVVTSLTFFSLVLGELVPKRIGLANPEQLAKLVARPMHFLSIITSPFVWLLTITSDLILKLLRIKKTHESNVTEEEIKAIIQEGTEGGAIQEIEQDIVKRVFTLGDRKVTSLMTHRKDIIYLKSTYNAKNVRNIVNAELHSVYPVTDSENSVQGIVLLKDLFKHIDSDEFSLESLVQNPKYITENMSAYEAMIEFKSSNIHQALVIDEYGQIQGILTLNDLLEALIGDVSEFYGSEYSFTQRADGSWLIDGQYPLSEMLHKLDLTEMAQDYPFDTVGGLILHLLKNVPKTGDKLPWLNFEIEILDMDGVRIDKILLRNI